ncbi:hypothetical protein CAMRE0001_0430 [Campylobacter rectus RM3267]|uniref:Uncharacterized protein n=1 Tax=Campylobacter rectus RM3267 TaxID=553218 RepID=B9D2J7_CAMRE|nr:hypothetical protein CAMRE0001_0430 [Campylobacter rectus RM3267]
MLKFEVKFINFNSIKIYETCDALREQSNVATSHVVGVGGLLRGKGATS